MSAQDSAMSVATLEKLKSAILNIDWEISDENIGILNQELSVLRSAWQGQKVHMIYLQILGALSQYIASTKEQGNPGAFPMLRTVFESLEDMLVNPTDEEQQTKKVMEHVEAYNELKNAVATRKAEPPPAPEPEPEAEPEPEVQSEPELDETPEEVAEVEEESSTINRLLDDKEDHTTDSIFDSMLDEMVQVEPPEQEEEPPAAPAPPPPKAPPGRPPVQAAYNKDDGTEVEADRNIDESFAEADELLDNFFEDDVPAPGAAAKSEGDEFDLSALDEEEGDVLDLDQAAEEEPGAAAPADSLELSLEDRGPEAEELPEAEAADLEHFEDGDLDIFKVEEEAGIEESAGQPQAAEEFPEMESALDDFFAGEEESPTLAAAGEPAAASGLGEELGEVDSALDDFFDEGELEAPEAAGVVTTEALESEIAPEPATAEAGPTATVAGLKTLLLSVDWEVDDQLLDRVDAEISGLSEQLAGNDAALIHLNFLNTVIHHVGREQSQVISESMACLKMVTESLEELVAAEAGQEASFTARAVSSFVDWHELVVADFEKRLAAAKRQGGELADTLEGLELTQEAGESSETQKLKNEILSEVRQILSQEMQSIRRELSAKD